MNEPRSSALDRLNRVFTRVAWMGAALIVSGVLGLIFLPANSRAVGAVAIGGGIVSLYGGLHARKTYRAAIARGRTDVRKPNRM